MLKLRKCFLRYEGRGALYRVLLADETVNANKTRNEAGKPEGAYRGHHITSSEERETRHATS